MSSTTAVLFSGWEINGSFAYKNRGRDKEGNPTGGWDLEELRSIQDFYVKQALSSAEGVSEVATGGGYLKEYQIDVDPNAMKVYGVTLAQIIKAVKGNNLDVGASTIEINRVEYFVRGLGSVKSVEDIEKTVVVSIDQVPIRIRDVAKVLLGPAIRRGALDKAGAEAVGGVVVIQYGTNPMEVIGNVKEKIKEITPGLPEKKLSDGTISRVTIVPFYDRSVLIRETLDTLAKALWLEILVTIIVVIVMLMNLRASIIVTTILPLSVLMCFIAMRFFNVEANVVALAGIAIAIGTMVDMGIVLSENIFSHLEEASPEENKLEVIYKATVEVSSAVTVAVATTIISFIPIFSLEGAEGKLFVPLALTKTFALVSALVVAIVVIPSLSYLIFSIKFRRNQILQSINVLILAIGLVLLFFNTWLGAILLLTGMVGLLNLVKKYFAEVRSEQFTLIQNFAYAGIVALVLTKAWLPLGGHHYFATNYIFVLLILGVILAFFKWILKIYPTLLEWCLNNKLTFLSLPVALLITGVLIMRNTGREFMPSLDEGSFLLMPTTMPHSGMQENLEMLKKLDIAVAAIPEVDLVVGKLGRVESALDPAPISMFENVINYKSEYGIDENGEYVRQWRDHIRTPDDIWEEISKATRFQGLTTAPKLQPMEARIVMLSTGIRSSIGIKVMGQDLHTIEKFGITLEEHIRRVEGVKPETVYAERMVGKPYLELELDRDKMAIYGLSIEELQKYIEVAIGGIPLTHSLEGRERYPIRVRYPRTYRESPHEILEVLVSTSTGEQIPLGEVVNLKYVQGPQSIKSEDGFLVGHVLLDKKSDYADVDVVENAKRYLEEQIQKGQLVVPNGVSYTFTGTYEDAIRANKRLGIVIPLALAIIFLILYLEFRSVMYSLILFSAVFIAFAGGFILMWLYGQDWFMNFSIFGTNLHQLFQMKTIHLSIAVWVGFLALFGIATDAGVLLATYLRQSFKKHNPQSVHEVRTAVMEAGMKRIRPAMMTTATTILALIPVLTSTGKGSDILLPMAIPSVGGMFLVVFTMFTIPVLFSMWQERKLK
ncbi:MAG: efflux RND transporter permease subunit, partial [Bacteroidetes bacterium]|nr:efflux RND transporter permease subunit [Bacteroidota bacterium]